MAVVQFSHSSKLAPFTLPVQRYYGRSRKRARLQSSVLDIMTQVAPRVGNETLK